VENALEYHFEPVLRESDGGVKNVISFAVGSETHRAGESFSRAAPQNGRPHARVFCYYASNAFSGIGSAKAAKGSAMSIRQRARRRRARMVVHRAAGYEDADRWDLEFWQAMTPQERLSALVDIHEDIARVRGRRRWNRD